MSIPTKARVREVLAEIRADMERDVNELDGKPLTGRTVAESHGKLAAAISALASIVDTLVQEKP